MAEFPAKVSTETSSPQTRGGLGIESNMAMDVSFIKTFPAILLLTEIVLGLVAWALVASASHLWVPATGWVLFVTVTLWLLTIILFIILFLAINRTLTSVPWPLALLVFYSVATVLYFTAFIANAASVTSFRWYSLYYNNMAAAAFFGIVVTLAYGASTFFAYMSWKGNPVSTTVPV
ncbi:plasmolipin [Chanos chanos]|uniref:Plasmolipin n=1 Tax=Chanos chanos TaxID=29144 RepID=A0A6J2WQB8_CHACN|nr:plasmolipin [Chanos chanos]